jgi:guanylate kinase
MKPGKLFVLSAPSGAGKTTLKDLLMRQFPQLGYSISATTREPRPGEREGEHYFFKTPEQFQAMIREKQLVEFNRVHGHYYGTPRQFIKESLEQGKSLVLDLDVYGKINFDRVFSEAIGILIEPPGFDELEKRLKKRSTDSEQTVRLRMENAVKELEFARNKGKYEYTVVNDDLDNASAKLQAIVASELGLR